jgi:hypothetical protein
MCINCKFCWFTNNLSCWFKTWTISFNLNKTNFSYRKPKVNVFFSLLYLDRNFLVLQPKPYMVRVVYLHHYKEYVLHILLGLLANNVHWLIHRHYHGIQYVLVMVLRLRNLEKQRNLFIRISKSIDFDQVHALKREKYTTE